MTEQPAATVPDDNAAYQELARLSRDVVEYRRYRGNAEERRDAEIKCIELETARIEEAQTRIRELVAELGFTQEATK